MRSSSLSFRSSTAAHADRGAGGDHLVADRRSGSRQSRCRAARRRHDVGDAPSWFPSNALYAGRIESPPPTGVAELLEAVPVGLAAAVVDHAVHGARPSEGLAPHPRLDAVGGARTDASGRTTRTSGCRGACRIPAGCGSSRLLSLPPASSRSTRFAGFSDRRLASTQPAEPAPTTMWSNSSTPVSSRRAACSVECAGCRCTRAPRPA